MEHLRPDTERPRPSLPFLNNHLFRSLPSTQSLASTLSPGATTPNSWTANAWSRGTPDTSPPTSSAGSPELKAKPRLEDGSISPVEALEIPQAKHSVTNICFIGAGFVGKTCFFAFVT